MTNGRTFGKRQRAKSGGPQPRLNRSLPGEVRFKENEPGVRLQFVDERVRERQGQEKRRLGGSFVPLVRVALSIWDAVSLSSWGKKKTFVVRERGVGSTENDTHGD